MSNNPAADQIERELDPIADIAQKPLLMAVFFWWGWFHKTGDAYQLFDIQIPLREAFYVACAFYIFAFLRLGLAFRRIRDIILYADKAETEDWSRALAGHPALLNPFADYRRTGTIAWHSRMGPCMIVLVWWFCHLSLFHVPLRPNWLTYGLSYLFVFAGLWTGWQIVRVYLIAARTARAVESIWGERWIRLGRAAFYPAVVALFLGMLVFSQTHYFGY